VRLGWTGNTQSDHVHRVKCQTNDGNGKLPGCGNHRALAATPGAEAAQRRGLASAVHDGVGRQEQGRPHLDIAGLIYVDWMPCSRDWQRPAVSPKWVATDFERRKRLGSSTTALKVGAATMPTPGADMSSLQIGPSCAMDLTRSSISRNAQQ